MDDDDDDFFAYQTAKSLNNKRTQLKQYFQSASSQRINLSSTDSESECENDLTLTKKKAKSVETVVPTTTAATIRVQPKDAVAQKDLIKNQIDAIVTSCFQSNRKETKRKIKLGKRTAADDQEFDEEEEYLSQLSQEHHSKHHHRNALRSLNRSHLQEDEEKVTRETAAYDRLDAVLRVTKPVCERTNSSDEEEDEDQSEMDRGNVQQVKPTASTSLDQIRLKIDHSDGRQLNLSLPSQTTIKQLYEEVSDRLLLSSISLVYQNQTLKIDEDQEKTLKQLGLTPDDIHLIESYPVIRKLRLVIQTSNSIPGRRSSGVTRREYSMVTNDRFEKIFELYRNEMNWSKIRFEFDGDEIHPKATPEDYQMNDGEILDAYFLSTKTNDSQ